MAIAVGLMAINAGVWYSGSVFFVALIGEFGWSYAATASILSLFSVVAGVWGLLAGALVDRLGARRVVFAGAIVLGLALMADGLATTRWHLYLTHSLFATLGLSGIGWVPMSILLARRFSRHRGLALGVASGGVGLGLSIIVPLTQAMIDAWGWRLAFVGFGLLVSGVALPLAWMLPADEGRARPEPGGRAREPWPVWWAARQPAFWGIALSFVLLNAPVQLTLTHQVAHLVEGGMSRMTAAGLVGLMGVFSIAGKVGWGYLSDRWWLEWTYTAGIVALVAGIGALLALEPGSSRWLVYAYAACLGFGYAISPALTPILTGRFFAGPRFGTIFGALALVHNGAGAAGMWIAGYAHDLTGSYRMSLLASIGSALLAAVAVWLLAPRRRAVH